MKSLIIFVFLMVVLIGSTTLFGGAQTTAAAPSAQRSYQVSPTQGSYQAAPTQAPYAEQIPHTGTAVRIQSPGIFDLEVVQQPMLDNSYVSAEPEKATQFSTATQYGSVGILAHNYLAGAQFFQLQRGSQVNVVFNNGQQASFVVQDIRSYQALEPYNTRSSFVPMEGPSTVLTAADLFKQIYAVSDRLVLQTCIEANGEPSWGRLFVIATPR